MPSGIYCIERIETGQKYIGKGVNVTKEMNRSHAGCAYIYNAIQKHGQSAFIRYIIEYCDKSMLSEKEQYYIKLLNTKSPNGYNLTEGGRGQIGWIPSKKTRDRISKANKGKVRSFETKEKMSKAAIGKPKSLETIKRISEAKKGKPRSLESRKKQGKTMSGENNKKTNLKNLEVLEIKRLLKLGVKSNLLTKMFRVKKSVISHIKNEWTWKDVN